MNRRKFGQLMAASPLVFVPKTVAAAGGGIGDTLNADETMEIITTGFNALNGYMPAGAISASSWEELKAMVNGIQGPQSVQAMADGYLDIGWLADTMGVCMGAYMLSETRLTRAGSLALGRMCAGAGVAWFVGWNMGTAMYKAGTYFWYSY